MWTLAPVLLFLYLTRKYCDVLCDILCVSIFIHVGVHKKSGIPISSVVLVVIGSFKCDSFPFLKLCIYLSLTMRKCNTKYLLCWRISAVVLDSSDDCIFVDKRVCTKFSHIFLPI